MNEAAHWAKFVKYVMMFDLMYIGKQVRDEEAISYMFEKLKHYNANDVFAAFDSYAIFNKGLIGISDIVNHIEGSPKQRSNHAWRVFRLAYSHPGGYYSVRFPDPAYHYAIAELGGWARCCYEIDFMEKNDESFYANNWRSLYERGLALASWHDEDGRVKVYPYLRGDNELNAIRSRSGEMEEVRIIGTMPMKTLPQKNFEKRVLALPEVQALARQRI